MAELHGKIERDFRLGKLYARWAVHEAKTNKLRVCVYYTPVTPRLKKLGEQLGNYLHVMKQHRSADDPWWHEFRVHLDECAAALKIATSGLMLGPGMRKDGAKQAQLYLEVPPGMQPEQYRELYGDDGELVFAHVSYPEALPEPIEPEAMMWPTGDSSLDG